MKKILSTLFFISIKCCFSQNVAVLFNTKNIKQPVRTSYRIAHSIRAGCEITAPISLALINDTNGFKIDLKKLRSSIAFAIWDKYLNKYQTYVLEKKAIAQPGTYELTFKNLDNNYLLLNPSPIKKSNSIVHICAAYDIKTKKLLGVKNKHNNSKIKED